MITNSAISFPSLYTKALITVKRREISYLKKAEIRPFYKNDGRTDKSNYVSIRILSNVAKIYERYLYSQLYDYFDKNIFSKY